MTKRKRTKVQVMIYKAMLKKGKIGQHEPHKKRGMNASAAEGYAVSAP